LETSTDKTREYYKGLLEALIFLSSEPLKISSISSSAGIDKSLTRELLDELSLEFEERNGGFILKEIAGAYQFYTNEVYFQILGSIFKEKRRETLSKSTLDTLAIIAYKQPITLPEVDEIRGVSSRAMITTLVAKKLIKPIGQKEVPGRPTLYGTTSEFLIHFGLNKLSDLPPPNEVKELKFEDLGDLEYGEFEEEDEDEEFQNIEESDQEDEILLPVDKVENEESEPEVMEPQPSSESIIPSLNIPAQDEI
jgi:segregation and condensation protein B